MPLDYTRISKTVAHALRHEPWVYELELDDEGWTPVDALLAALRAESPAWAELTAADLEEMIRRADKKRYELVGPRIRAFYGHSVPGKLTKTPARPPALLYHGTSPKAVATIRREGLRPMSRQYVHLSADPETATLVGRRKAPQPFF